MATYKVPILGGDALNTGDLLRWNGSAWDTTTTPETARLTLTDVCSSADGANFLRVTGLQVDGTAMTGTLRGAYIDVSNGSTAATGTIRAMELKARTEAPEDTGNDVNVLEGLSISADSKGHSVTTMRAAEFILDGTTGGTITEAVGLRIANNLQANKATTSYGLQIYRDSFDYTADIQLSSGGLIGGSGGHLNINSTGNTGLGVAADATARLIIGSTDASDNIKIWHDNLDANFSWNDGGLLFITDEGDDTNTVVKVRGKGAGIGRIYIFDEDDNEYLDIFVSSGVGFLNTVGSAPAYLALNYLGNDGVSLFHSCAEEKTAELKIYGRRLGDSRRSLEIGVGVDAADTASFDGVSNYRFDGNLVIANGGYIGSVGDTDAIQIEADGDVVFTQDIKITGTAYFDAQQTATGDGTTTIDWGLGNKFYFTFGAANETFTFTAPGGPCNLILVLKQDGTGSRTVTWPNTVMWPGGTAPTLSTGAAAVDLISFYYDGTNYFGNSSLNYSVPA